MSFKNIVRELRDMKDGFGCSSRGGTDMKRWRSRTRSYIAPDVAPPDEVVEQGQWANLPPELLLDIIQRVEDTETSWPARCVVVFCASVCKSWREVTKEIVKTPEECGRLTFPISLKQPGPRDSPIQCFIKRERGTSIYRLFFGLTPSEDGSDKLLLAAKRIRRPTGDLNHLLLMADITLYASSQKEQGFPSMLLRAMSFGLPAIVPDYPVMKKYVTNRVHGLIFSKHEPDALTKAFSLLIVNGKISKLAHSIASSGRLLAKNMLAAECITDYALLLENVVDFPSDVLLPGHISKITQKTWEWHYLQDEIEKTYQFLDGSSMKKSSVVYELEDVMSNHILLKNVTSDNPDILGKDFPTRVDWDILRQIERSEELETLESEEIKERTEMDIGEWDEIYRNARKAEKLKFETNERDEGELERTGQPVCIYEIYNGAGAWPFLHHGSLYRGLSLSTKSRRLTSDDVDAVGRLPLLNDTYYSDLLCDIGGMFSIANRIDDIHKRPWIGFQSWRAAGRMASLSTKAEQVLEKTIQENTKGDVLYFWGNLDMERELEGTNNPLTFWSMCDILNGGNCRIAFEDTFRRMYALPSNVEALPPMPKDGGHWSALHSWVMPTPSFLEFVMFSRMFVDSLHTLHVSSSSTSCVFGSSDLEKRHCYCQVLELLVNVWAYHSGRRMVYIDPSSGFLQEQYPVELRQGSMWVKYFNLTLLKSMDEDLAEASDDNDHPYEMWLWPLTGEVYWQGTYEREREERYRMKMDKKRKLKEKLLERMKYGYKQRTLGG